ncbi:Asp-tRNA(Asn)/Glu-tRNA(Gln) amidotransferase GatCAB subunit B [Pedobacter yulinensis]|uniref:Aspartyl/glutamyl-tRNA(Asn/Gln) amidotransferase subunit B n=1 Tax=Pedobacter yulinensis TaxID=2126353 RepID=A0A2T3HLH0_9SPHI|nr:Asp-tRNA(Asn)/Glu-tRNA(Gln) amidotransferase subunit GatB [Pedobacter yulinensis]PST83308.1 Asp-tRNA(Asn)/Glu-tRNA(Gln) amidotransferase GatCAB subunit B [Pedobacter yulinensis]
MHTDHEIDTTEFELVSGLEIHVQLNTKSKIFCSDSAAYGAGPNEHISPVSLALPGALPKLNREVVAKAIRMGLALNCQVNQHNFFDRKNYFYADLPKGYQITQDRMPICGKGYLDVTLKDGSTSRIGINRIHLEEDAGKSIHDQDDKFSYIDLNRAGVPLIEIVTEPDIRSAEEAAALFSEIRKLVRHLDVSDGNMEEGSLRCDANISIRPQGEKTFGTRCEVKNLNSIRNVRRAIQHEFSRQERLIRSGGSVIQSTLNFDAEAGTTSPMREKEEANDYRYFADPDLQPVYISDAWLAEIRAAMPAMPEELAAGLQQKYGLAAADALIIARDADQYGYFLEGADLVQQPKILANWMLGPVKSILNDREADFNTFAVRPARLAAVISLVESKKVTQNLAVQKLLPAMAEAPDHDPAMLAEQMNLLIVEDSDELESFIAAVFEKFPAQVESFKKGKKGVLGLFVGEVMKLAKGKADPKTVNEKIISKLK